MKFKAWLENWQDTSWSGDNYTITIQQVIDWLQNKPVIDVNIGEIRHLLLSSGLDQSRIEEADLKYPIILVKANESYTMILDGNHRFQKIINSGEQIVKAKVLDLDDQRTPQEFRALFKR